MRRVPTALTLCAALTGCDTGTPPAESFCVTSFMPVPVVFFVYPGKGAKNVSPSIGELVFAGATGGYIVGLTGPGHTAVAVGPPHPAPSPLPSPIVPPPPGITTFASVNVPALAAGSTYAVSFSYRGSTGVPPECIGTITRQVGSFTTH